MRGIMKNRKFLSCDALLQRPYAIANVQELDDLILSEVPVTAGKPASSLGRALRDSEHGCRSDQKLNMRLSKPSLLLF